MDHEFKIGDWVTNQDWGQSSPFQLESEHYKGITQRSDEWFTGLKKWIPEKSEWCVFWNDHNKECFIIARFDKQDKHVTPYITAGGSGRFQNIAPMRFTDKF